MLTNLHGADVGLMGLNVTQHLEQLWTDGWKVEGHTGRSQTKTFR